MDFKIEFDTSTGEGKLFIYEEWVKKRSRKNKVEKKKILKDEPIGTIEFAVGEKDLHVSSLDVDEEYRRKGFGKLLMQIIFALGVYFDKQIELVSGNDDANKFYRAIKMKPKRGEKDEFIWIPPKPKKRL